MTTIPRSCAPFVAIGPSSIAPPPPAPRHSILLRTQRSGFYPNFIVGPSKRLPFVRICAALSTAVPDVQTKDQELATVPTTPVILTVRNMKCGGCSAAVKRMLLQQPGITGAAVNLLTETAVIQVTLASGSSAEQVAQRAANALGDKGFPAELREPDDDDIANTAAAINERRTEELKES